MKTTTRWVVGQFGLHDRLLMGPRAPSPACCAESFGGKRFMFAHHVRARAPAVPQSGSQRPNLEFQTDHHHPLTSLAFPANSNQLFLCDSAPLRLTLLFQHLQHELSYRLRATSCYFVDRSFWPLLISLCSLALSCFRQRLAQPSFPEVGFASLRFRKIEIDHLPGNSPFL